MGQTRQLLNHCHLGILKFIAVDCWVWKNASVWWIMRKWNVSHFAYDAISSQASLNSPNLSNGCIWWATLLNSQIRKLPNRNHELLQITPSATDLVSLPPKCLEEDLPAPCKWFSFCKGHGCCKNNCQKPREMNQDVKGILWLSQKQKELLVIETKGCRGRFGIWSRLPNHYLASQRKNLVDREPRFGLVYLVLKFPSIRFFHNFDKGRYDSPTQTLARHLQQRLLLALRPGVGRSVNFQLFQLRTGPLAVAKNSLCYSLQLLLTCSMKWWVWARAWQK